MRKFIVFIVLLLSSKFLFAQVQLSNAPMVNVDFNNEFYKEEFDSSSVDWPTISNFNNLFMAQNGSYYLNRKVKGDPYALICSKTLNLSAYQLSVRVNPIAIAPDGFIGVLFMLQESSVGGFIFEIGPNQNCRLRQVNNGIYKNVTGDIKSNGWIALQDVIKYNQNNTLKISFNDRNYDLYINNYRLISFNDIEYKNGSFGLLIGPETKASIDNISIFSNSLNKDDELTQSTIIPENSIEFKNLKNQIEKLQNDNDELLNVVERMRSKGYSSPDDNEAKYVSSVANYNSLKLKYDSLVTEFLNLKRDNDSLNLQQITIISSDQNFDQLMMELEALKAKNATLESEKAILNRKLKKLNNSDHK